MDKVDTRNTGRAIEICYVLIALQALLYIAILRAYLRTTGTWTDVGSNFLAFWALAIVPASLILALLVRVAYRSWMRASRPKGMFFAGALLLDAILLYASLALYARHLHG